MKLPPSAQRALDAMVDDYREEGSREQLKQTAQAFVRVLNAEVQQTEKYAEELFESRMLLERQERDLVSLRAQMSAMQEDLMEQVVARRNSNFASPPPGQGATATESDKDKGAAAVSNGAGDGVSGSGGGDGDSSNTTKPKTQKPPRVPFVSPIDTSQPGRQGMPPRHSNDGNVSPHSRAGSVASSGADSDAAFASAMFQTPGTRAASLAAQVKSLEQQLADKQGQIEVGWLVGSFACLVWWCTCRCWFGCCGEWKR